ncbi:MAG: hypothetical protein QOC98_953 [Frankiaceae bacterium]|nr:hypothetical protein [Frankiaceae bacterium]
MSVTEMPSSGTATRLQPSTSDGPLVEFAELVRVLQDLPSLAEVLEHAVAGAARLVGPAKHVTVSVIDHRAQRTTVATSAVAREIDEAQFARGDGPGVCAMEQGTAVRSDNGCAANRWPQLGSVLKEAGVDNVLSLPLSATDGTFGSLSLFGAPGAAFGTPDVAGAEAWAAIVALSLLPHRRASQWQEALDSRDVIGQAKGILMERFRISADAAFAMLVEASQTRNRKLRDIAATITETGQDLTAVPRRRS